MVSFFGGSSRINPEASQDFLAIKSFEGDITKKVADSTAIKDAFNQLSSTNFNYRNQKSELGQLSERVITHLSSTEQLQSELTLNVRALANKVTSCQSEISKLETSIILLENKKTQAEKCLQELPKSFFTRKQITQEGKELAGTTQSIESQITSAKKDLESKQKEKDHLEKTISSATTQQTKLAGHITEIKALQSQIQQINPLSKLSLQDKRTSLIKELAFRIFYSELAVPQPIIDKLSGNDPRDSLEKMISDLETKGSDGVFVFEKIMGTESYQKCLGELKELREVTGQITRYRGEERQTQAIMNKFTNLDVGQSKLYSGGYSGTGENPEGHSVIYEFKRVTQDKFELSLYNTGEGSSILFGPKVQTYFVSKEKIEDIYFWKGLLAFEDKSINRKREAATDAQNTQRSMSQVYQYLSSNLGNPKSKKSIEAQTWGNCTYMSLKAWVTSTLDDSRKKEFHTKVRQLAAEELKDALPHLSENEKKTIFGNEVISHLDRKVMLITNTETGIWAKIKRIWYYVSVSIVNFVKQLRP